MSKLAKAKKVFKWLGIVVGALALLLGLGAGVMSCLFQRRLDHLYTVEGREFEVPEDAESLREGERLFLARGCGECHGVHGEGRMLVDAPPFLVAPPNLTRVESAYTLADWDRLVRHGVRKDGRPVILMPAHEYRRMPDRELGPIVAYIRQLPERGEEQPPSEVHLLGRVLAGFGALGHILPAEAIDHDRLDPAPEAAPTADFGSYLAAGCTGCHGEGFSGGPVPGAPEEVVGIPPNLTPHQSGLRGWAEEDLVRLMRTGRRPDGSAVHPDHMPWRVYRHMSDVELSALWAFLRQVPARPFGQR